MVIPGDEPFAPSQVSTQTLGPGTHQSAVCMCVCDTARLPRMEARHRDRAQMAGDVLINSMQEVLSPG